MNQQQPPRQGAIPIKPEDIVAQLLVVQSKDQISVQLPGVEGSPDIAKSVELLGSALTMLAHIMRQVSPKEAPRIIPVSTLPKEFISKGRL